MLKINWKDVGAGGFFFAAGDSIGTLLNNEFLYTRLVGMFVLGAGLYAWEIPTYFNYLARRFSGNNSTNALKRTLCSALFFNPLWIAILTLAIWSFIYCFPVSLLFNYLIQNRLALRWRFFASSIFSALTARKALNIYA